MFRNLIAIIFIVSSSWVLSQTNEDSPYTSIGIGNVGFYGDAYSGGLGGAVVSTSDSTQTNLYNPSTYSLVAKQLPLFSFGLNHFQKRFSYNGKNSKGSYTGITHFALVVPFANRFGVAAGIKPLSRTGYDINDSELVNDSIYYNYAGSGDIQEFILGFSGVLINKTKHNLSLGINGKYYFGKIDNKRKAYKISNNLEVGGIEIQSLHANDLGFEIGLNYQYQINPTHRFNLGYLYRPGSNINFEKTQVRYYFSDFYNKSSYDTLLNTGGIGGEIFIPSKNNIGISYTYTPQNTNDTRRDNLMSLMITLDYALENWSDYKEKFGGSTYINRYTSSTSYRSGISFTPHRISNDRLLKFNYLKKLNYRIGAYFVNTPYKVNGEQLNDRGFSVGFGIPIIISKAVSTINLSATFGEMGSNKNTEILNERYFGFNFGINIAPGYDRWFRKYKLD